MTTPSTKLIYLEDFSLLESSATVVRVYEEEGKSVVELDQTVFYPQGGGQPYDQGTIEGPNGVFEVREVRFVDGVVKHIGAVQQGAVNQGDSIKCRVNKERRDLHSRIHSAGHLVDMAVHALKLGWTPGKGFHFPEGPYVEYTGSLNGLEKQQVIRDIEDTCNQLIQQGAETKVVFIEQERMHEVCHFVPDNIPEGKPGRVVMYGDFGVPCGGTHVKNLSDIGKMTIRKIKPSGEILRVAYQVAA